MLLLFFPVAISLSFDTTDNLFWQPTKEQKKKKPHICGACNKVINSNFRVAYFIYVLFIQFTKLFIMLYMIDFEPIKHGINLSFNMIKGAYKKKKKI